MSLVKPISPLVLPSDLVGVPNGSLPLSLLTPCGVNSGYPPFGVLPMHHLASRAMKAMLASIVATLPGHDIRGTSALRSYASQVVAFDGTNPASRTSTNGRYIPQEGWAAYVSSGGKFVETDVKSWQGKSWKRRAGTAMAAVPGTSNHGLGLAIDFSEEYDGNPLTAEGITVELTKWLIANAVRFGYSAEAQSEDWHWRYFTGDNLPQAVLEYESGHTPPPSYDEDMPTLYRDSRFWNVFLVNGDVTTIGPALNDSLIARGVVQVVDTHDQSLFSFMRKSQIKTGQMVASSTPGAVAWPADLVGN